MEQPGQMLPDLCNDCTKRASEVLAAKTPVPTHGIGDKVAAVTGALGFKQKPGCGCARRQKALNNVNMNGTATEVARALFSAITNPPKEETK